MQANGFRTHSLHDARIGRILAAALDAVRPGRLVLQYLDEHPLPPHNRLYILGIGKAAEGMVRAAATRVQFAGALAITKQASGRMAGANGPASPGRALASSRPGFILLEAGHPLPDNRSVAAGEAVMHFVTEIRADDLLLCLISGGGSALVAAPRSGVSLEDLRQVTDALLRSGASIEEINIVRRRLDRLKGGGLAAATPSPVISLILSDVMDDRLDTIASGLTVSGQPATVQPRAILEKYEIRTPSSLDAILSRPRHWPSSNPRPRVQNLIVGNNLTARAAAYNQARLEGFHSVMEPGWVQGEASNAGRVLASQLATADREMGRPFCIIAGGETTVSVGSGGTGGRNQELALAAVDPLAGLDDVLFIAVATDGNDGPTDAAGAVATGQTCERAAQAGMRADTYLARHDSYHFFDALGDLLRIGYTGTNVNDLALLVGV